MLTNQSITYSTLFDSHCHLDFAAFDNDRQQVISQCQASGIQYICIPGVSEQSWSKLLSITAQSCSPVKLFSALGLHPYYHAEHKPCHLDKLSHLLKKDRDRIHAIGETGLDFALKGADSVRQIKLFEQQLDLARDFHLPVIIHARKSHDQILKRLRSIKLERAGIIHAFSGSQQQAEQYIDLGFKLGFGGGVTYERARKTRQLVRTLALESIVLETDAPDMPLSGFQGQRNTPARLTLVAEVIAELRGISVGELSQRTTRNSLKILAPELVKDL